MELFGDDEDNYKGESAYRKEVAAARRFWESGVFVTNNNEMLKENYKIIKNANQID